MKNLCIFQPTLPARGATWFCWSRGGCNNISTHAPRTGSDIIRLRYNVRKRISTHAPRTGSDQAHEPTQERGKKISTHAPRTGSDRKGNRPRRRALISTHAPRTGSDIALARVVTKEILFQPTLPARGATARHAQEAANAALFQPTLPARGATAQSNNSVDQNHRLCTKSIP